jgi:subtilisin family serine protease
VIGNVAILDSGIQPDHPDLNVVGGVNCNGPGTSYADDWYHGTMVAGFVGALDNGIGRVGVAPGVRLFAVRVLNKHGSGSTADLLCGLDWVTSTRTDADPTNDIAVGNMSLGQVRSDADDGNCGRTDGSLVHQAICRSVAAGVTYVAGAGNSAIDLKDVEPASYDEVLAATGIADSDGKPGGTSVNPFCDGYTTERDDTAASFSNFATLTADRAHVVAAPAVCIGSTYLGGTYGVASGTSFASPLVTGTVALCLATRACRGLTPPQVVAAVVRDASAYSTRVPSYGFVGDPNHPASGRYYGALVRAGGY